MQQQDPENISRQSDWQELEALNDILFDAADPSIRLQRAVSFVIERMGYSRAALLVQEEGEKKPLYRVYCNVPLDWRVGFDEPSSPLSQISRAALSGMNVYSAAEQGLAGAFPLAYKDRRYGALFVFGPAIDEKNIPRWARFAGAIGRAVYSWDSAFTGLSLNQDIQILETLLSIQNSRNTLLTFFDSIPASVYIVDQAFTLISVNLSRSGRLNKHPSVLVGKKCYEQLFHRTGPCPACRVMETFTGGTITNRTRRERDESGRAVEWEITTFPIQEPGQSPHRAIVFEEDVTEKRNLEANLIQSEKLASVGQLAAGVAHEINNPLAAIIANAQLIKRDLPQDHEHYSSVELIEMAGQRAAQVVNDLLSLARKDDHDEFELISLNENIRSALTLVSHEAKNHSVSIKLDLDDEIPLITASGYHLQGVWINLIMNGIDSIDQRDGKIIISTRYISGEFRIVVEDNGRGIPRENLPRIFEPFFTTKETGKGTGLGLSVCYRVVKEHQGTLAVESQPGEGTRFLISLPDLADRQKQRLHSGE